MSKLDTNSTGPNTRARVRLIDRASAYDFDTDRVVMDRLAAELGVRVTDGEADGGEYGGEYVAGGAGGACNESGHDSGATREPTEDETMDALNVYETDR